MVLKPKLVACTLQSPPDAEPVVLSRSVTATSSQPFDGQPDPDSPAQRTLHQSLANRLIGQANIYSWLREYAFRTAWGFQPPELDGGTVTLAIAHQSHGPKVAFVIRSQHWSSTMGDRLVDHGWHVLTLDASRIVQASHDAVSDILRVLHLFAGLPTGTGDLDERSLPSAGDLASGSTAVGERRSERDPDAARASHRAKVPIQVVRRKSPRWAVWGAVTVLAVAVVGLYAVSDRSKVAMPWHKSAAFTTTVDSVTVTKEGHAAVTLAGGRKAFVPATAVQRHPNLLHNLIVAWRQGKSLNVFTTNKQHLKYGREIGVKVPPTPKPAKGRRH